MKYTEFYAPRIDAIIQGSSPGNNQISYGTYLKLKDTYKAFSCIKAEDEIRHTWLEVDRGPVEAFGDYKEFRENGEVSSRKEFEKLWKDYYPDKTVWYEFHTAEYDGTLYFYLNGKLLFSIKVDEPPVGNTNDPDGFFDKFVEWLKERILNEGTKLKQDPQAYNSYIQQNLSWAKRTGRIKKKDYWNILGDNTIRPDKNLGENIILKLEDFVSDMNMGAHPWEICRGGNSTHISLFVSDIDKKWGIQLAGSSIVRVEETVKMAVALNEKNIPFKLRDADEIVRMVTGNDYIGIVPDTVFPRYCHSLFPKEDKIIDFMNLGYDKEIIEELIQKIYWYPLEEIIPEECS